MDAIGMFKNFECRTQNQDLLINFHELLIKKLYLNNIQAVKKKYQLERFVPLKDTLVAVHEDNFIRFGTKKATNFIIIDIDYCEVNLECYCKEINTTLSNYGFSWLLKTNKGYHLGFMLDKPLFLNNIDDMDKYNFIVTFLSLVLKADVTASKRAYGFYRNPLSHDSYLSNKTFNLDDMYSYFSKLNDKYFKFNQKKENTVKINMKTNTNNISNISDGDFIKGNRNNYLFKKVLGLVYKGRIKKDEVLSTLKHLNNNELKKTEINKIAKSILKYTKDFRSKGSTSSAGEYKKGFYWERMRKYNIHNIKIANKTIFNRQKLGQTIRTVKVIQSTITKLTKAYVNLYKNKTIKATNKSIASFSRISVRTLQRYRNNRKIEKKIKNSAFLIYIRDMYSNKKSVKASVMVIDEVINFAVKSIQFKCVKTNTLYYFEMRNEKLLFYPIREA